MLYVRALAVGVSGVIVSAAAGQILPVIQERSVQTQVSVSSGQSDGGFDEAANFGPFVRDLPSAVTGPGGASSAARAMQNTSLGAAAVTGSLAAHSAVATGTTFITGESDAQSSLLYIFNLSAATPVQFTANGGLSYIGRNPEGEPSDLDGMSSVRLINAITETMIAGFQLNHEPGTNSASFNDILLPGQYAILATARMHAFSADLLGPPARSGSGDADVSFSLTVVPAPGVASSLLLGAALLGGRRRRIDR